MARSDARHDGPAGREADWAERPLDPRDYSRRTLLANERTYLAWWRTGLTALTAALAVARVVPELADVGTRWPYTAVGILFAVVGLIAIGYGQQRRTAVERAVRRGEFPPTSGLVTAAMTAIGLLIGVALVILSLVDG